MISVADILNSLGMRQRTAQLRRLDALAPADRERVEQVLASMPSSATIDIDKLVADLRRQAQEHAVAAPEADPLAAFNYFCSFADEAQLLTCKRELERGASVEDAMAAAHRIGAQTAPETREIARGHTFEPAPEDEPLDDEPLDSPPRRVRRVRLRRRELNGRAREPDQPPRLAVWPKVFGVGADSRPRGCPVDVGDYEKRRQPGPPPGLEEETATTTDMETAQG